MQRIPISSAIVSPLPSVTFLGASCLEGVALQPFAVAGRSGFQLGLPAFPAPCSIFSSRSCTAKALTAPDPFTSIIAPPVQGADSAQKHAASLPKLSDRGLQILHDRAESWLRRSQSEGLAWESGRENPVSGYVRLLARGIPTELSLRQASGVYRHYIRGPEQMEQILSTGMLQEGRSPAWYVSGNAHTIFQDIVGIFVTRPSARAEHIGSHDACGFVDFLLPGGTLLFHLPWYKEEQEVYVIPGAGMGTIASTLLNPKFSEGEKRERLSRLATPERVEELLRMSRSELLLEMPIGITARSSDDPALSFQTLSELLQGVGTLPLKAELSALSYRLHTWQKIVQESGLRPQPSVRPSQHYLHARKHLLHTAYLAVLIAKRSGIEDARTLQALWYAGIFHDVGRSGQYGAFEDPGHAKRSAQDAGIVLKLSGVDDAMREMVQEIIADHTSDDEAGLSILSRIFKDADALERFRFGPDGCDTRYLRTEAARGLVQAAKRFYGRDA